MKLTLTRTAALTGPGAVPLLAFDVVQGGQRKAVSRAVVTLRSGSAEVHSTPLTATRQCTTALRARSAVVRK